MERPSAAERPARTVREALIAATARLHESASETARLDAEVLLGFVLGVDRSLLAAHPEVVLSTGQTAAFEACLERRAKGEPVAYIRGLKEFYGVAIRVDGRVLIPRPETETLVELAIERVRADLTAYPRESDSRPYRVWDVGTGSGAIAVAMGSELRRRRYADAVHFHVSDRSADAIAVATINAVSHGLADLFTFALGDLTDVVPAPYAVELLVANLPYIPSASIPDLPVAASFEPIEALDGGPDGLAVIRRLLPGLPAAVASRGTVLLEIGADQLLALREAVEELLPHWTCRIHPDLGGSPRVAQLERGP
jgi:release factor glutamine methyltransferase